MFKNNGIEIGSRVKRINTLMKSEDDHPMTIVGIDTWDSTSEKMFTCRCHDGQERIFRQSELQLLPDIGIHDIEFPYSMRLHLDDVKMYFDGFECKYKYYLETNIGSFKVAEAAPDGSEFYTKDDTDKILQLHEKKRFCGTILTEGTAEQCREYIRQHWKELIKVGIKS